MNPFSWDPLTWIAMLSLAVAVIAALYAKWVWTEARKTNLLALHVHRLEVFRDFQRLRQSVQEKGMGTTAQAVKEFYQPSRESKFYFSSKKTSELLVQYFNICFSIAEQTRKLDRENLDEQTRLEIESRQDELSKQEQFIYLSAEKLLEKELTQAVRRRWFDA